MLSEPALRSALADSIRYPSAKNQPGGICMAVFPERLTPPAYIEVYDPDGNLAQHLP